MYITDEITEPYLMCSILYKLLENQPGKFANIIPLLTEWRDIIKSNSPKRKMSS